MGLKIVNGAWATLAAGISSGDVTVNLSAGQGTRFGSFSAGDYMYATLIKAATNEVEYIKITARSTDALTVARAQDGSTAIAFNAGDRIECRPVNAAVRAAVQEPSATEMSGTNTYTGSLDPAPTAYNTNQVYLLGFANTNTTSAPTVNLNSLGAKTIKKPGGSSLSSGDLPRWGILFYDGTDMILSNPMTPDDQEAGTFTPTLTFGGASTGITYGSQQGLYTKIGNRVFFSANIELTSKGSATGTARVEGLPETVSGSIAASIRISALAAGGAGGAPSALLVDGTTTCLLQSLGETATAVADLTDANFSNTTTIIIGGSYRF